MYAFKILVRNVLRKVAKVFTTSSAHCVFGIMIVSAFFGKLEQSGRRACLFCVVRNNRFAKGGVLGIKKLCSVQQCCGDFFELVSGMLRKGALW